MSVAETNADIIADYASSEAVTVGLVLGSGLSDLGDLLEDRVTLPFSELMGFPSGDVSGHGTTLLIGRLNGKRIAVLTGRSHYYETGRADAMRVPLETLQAIGVRTLLLTNSAGSLKDDMPPGTLMMFSDHINYNGRNPLIGASGDERFVNMRDAYDVTLRQQARAIADDLMAGLKEGVYAWYAGPSFETPAEIRMIRGFGADAVGMSTVPETILARFLGMKVWACSAITNMGAGLSDEIISHHHTREIARQGARKLEMLVERLVGEI